WLRILWRLFSRAWTEPRSVNPAGSLPLDPPPVDSRPCPDLRFLPIPHDMRGSATRGASMESAFRNMRLRKQPAHLIPGNPHRASGTSDNAVADILRRLRRRSLLESAGREFRSLPQSLPDPLAACFPPSGLNK